VFSERGADASLDDVAKRANVGIGTLIPALSDPRGLLAAACDRARLALRKKTVRALQHRRRRCTGDIPRGARATTLSAPRGSPRPRRRCVQSRRPLLPTRRVRSGEPRGTIRSVVHELLRKSLSASPGAMLQRAHGFFREREQALVRTRGEQRLAGRKVR